MDLLLKWGGITICAGVVLGCICRINLMETRLRALPWGTWLEAQRSIARMVWPLIYLGFAVHCFGTAIDLALGRWVDWYTSVGVASMAMNMLVTRTRWRDAAPPETEHSDWAGLPDLPKERTRGR